ncbi:MAG TPA: helix-turn-helix domain-containing protein [Ktedonobacterales bacterium]|jgi:excisionase family DNA binding protein|nr:helix-turn-helix domain-containing protein [Ktedonobacterales bacterium]
MSAQTARKQTASKGQKQKRTPRKRTLPGDGLVLYSVEEAANRLNIGRTVAYRLVGTGIIESFKVAGLRRITVDALARYVEQCQMLTTRKRSA